MSRVERKEHLTPREAGHGRQATGDRRDDPHPSQAEGDEDVVNEALRNHERSRREQTRH
jgi:hypothetical protein